MRWLLGILVAVALLLGVTVGQAADADKLLLLDSAWASLSAASGEHFEGRVRLTHRWDSAFPGQPGEAVYTLMLPPVSAHQVHSILFYRAGNQLDVHVNGQLLRRYGRLGDPSQDFAKGPLRVHVPSGVLHDDRPNQLQVHATLQPQRIGGLSHVLFGPEHLVEPVYRWNHAVRQGGQIAIAATSGVVALFALFLAVRLRDRLFAYASLAAFCWMLRAADRALVDSPLPWFWWGLISVLSYCMCACAVLVFLQHLLGIPSKALARWNLALLVGGPLLTGAAYLLRHPLVWDAVLALLSFLVLAGLVYTTLWALAHRSPRNLALAALCTLVMLSGLADVAMVGMRSRLMLESVGGGLSLTPYSMSLLLLGILWLVADRYAQAAQAEHILHEAAEAKLRQREAELAALFERQRVEHEQRMVQGERQRIMRDMHDGLGARLVSLVNLVKHGQAPAAELESQALAALDELRLTVDSLQPNEGDLSTVLGNLRYRMSPTFEVAGIAMDWRVEHLPPVPWLTPTAVLHIQHILLEVFTNAIRHSGASRIQVSAHHDAQQGAIAIRVHDNGQHDASPEAGGGHGIRNMHARAEAIGARLRWSRSPGGTEVEMVLADAVAGIRATSEPTLG